MVNMNLKAIFTKAISACNLKKTFDRVIGVYFDGTKIFCINLNLDDKVEKWKVIHTAELTPFINTQLSERSRAILAEFDALDDDIPNEQRPEEDIRDLIAKKVASICINEWQIHSVALCINTDSLIVEIEDLSNIPKEKIANTVHYHIAAAGNFEVGTYLSSFMETGSGVWMEGISKIESDKWIQSFRKHGMELLALTAMPNEVAEIEDVDLSAADENFLKYGGIKAVFVAKSLAYQTNPNFLIDKTIDLTGWNYNRITAAIVLVTFLILSVIGTLDFLDYRQVKSELEHERSQLSLLESDRRKEEFIAKELAELKVMNQKISTLTEESFPWRGLLVHFGTIKIQGVWLRELHALEDRTIEVKGEAVTYEAVSSYVRALENDSDVFKTVNLKNSEMKTGEQLVKFVIEVKFI